jgi:hypothetical protein
MNCLKVFVCVYVGLPCCGMVVVWCASLHVSVVDMWAAAPNEQPTPAVRSGFVDLLLAG